MKIKVEGMKELNDVCQRIPKEATGAAQKQLKRCLMDLENKSVKKAPKQSGALARSVRMETTETSHGISGMVGFFVPYATRQHEGLNFHHEQGEAKFLENPFKENMQKYIDSIAAAIKGAMSP